MTNFPKTLKDIKSIYENKIARKIKPTNARFASIIHLSIYLITFIRLLQHFSCTIIAQILLFQLFNSALRPLRYNLTIKINVVDHCGDGKWPLCLEHLSFCHFVILLHLFEMFFFYFSCVVEMTKMTLEDAQKKILEVANVSEKLGELFTFLLKEIQVKMEIIEIIVKSCQLCE